MQTRSPAHPPRHWMPRRRRPASRQPQPQRPLLYHLAQQALSDAAAQHAKRAARNIPTGPRAKRERRSTPLGFGLVSLCNSLDCPHLRVVASCNGLSPNTALLSV